MPKASGDGYLADPRNLALLARLLAENAVVDIERTRPSRMFSKDSGPYASRAVSLVGSTRARTADTGLARLGLALPS